MFFVFSDLCDPPYSLSDVLAPPMVFNIIFIIVFIIIIIVFIIVIVVLKTSQYFKKYISTFVHLVKKSVD